MTDKQLRRFYIASTVISLIGAVAWLAAVVLACVLWMVSA